MQILKHYNKSDDIYTGVINLFYGIFRNSNLSKEMYNCKINSFCGANDHNIITVTSKNEYVILRLKKELLDKEYFFTKYVF